MNKFLRYALSTAAAMVIATSANATTIWAPTDGDVNIIQFELGGLSLNGGSLALFEETAPLTAGNALVLGADGGQFLFVDNQDGSFTVDALIAGLSTGSITMTGAEFILAVDWGTGYVADSNVLQNVTDPTAFLIEFTDGINSGFSAAVDVRAVPLPATLWLFGTALLSLAGFKRRKA